jgi:hypothetical protein
MKENLNIFHLNLLKIAKIKSFNKTQSCVKVNSMLRISIIIFVIILFVEMDVIIQTARKEDEEDRKLRL